MIRILIHSPSSAIAQFLRKDLDPDRYEVSSVQMGPEFVQVFRRIGPQIVILDRVDERQEAAQIAIAMVKDIHPDTRIIIISEQSSKKDAGIIEQGIFYYLTSGAGRELIRVIQAAAQSMRVQQEGAIQ